MKLSTTMFAGDYSFLVAVKILNRNSWIIVQVYNICADNKSEIYNLETFHDRLHFAISVIG